MNATQAVPIRVTVNGERYERTVEPRLLLSDFLRHELGLSGTHVGCEHGVCGACTILLDGEPVRACLVFAVQTNGASIGTVEGLARDDGLHPLQAAFKEAHGLQCGFCTPGILMTMGPYGKQGRHLVIFDQILKFRQGLVNGFIKGKPIDDHHLRRKYILLH